MVEMKMKQKSRNFPDLKGSLSFETFLLDDSAVDFVGGRVVSKILELFL